MIVYALGLLLTVVGFTCSLFVLVHAFRRSLGTGVMVLCVPCYNVYYAFSQFEHPRKGPLLAAYLGCLALGGFLLSVAARP
jgi:benzodiazapine receptor